MHISARHHGPRLIRRQPAHAAAAPRIHSPRLNADRGAHGAFEYKQPHSPGSAAERIAFYLSMAGSNQASDYRRRSDEG